MRLSTTKALIMTAVLIVTSYIVASIGNPYVTLAFLAVMVTLIISAYRMWAPRR